MSRLEGHRLLIVTAIQQCETVELTHYFLKADLLFLLQIKEHWDKHSFITMNISNALGSDPQLHL